MHFSKTLPKGTEITLLLEHSHVKLKPNVFEGFFLKVHSFPHILFVDMFFLLGVVSLNFLPLIRREKKALCSALPTFL